MLYIGDQIVFKQCFKCFIPTWFCILTWEFDFIMQQSGNWNLQCMCFFPVHEDRRLFSFANNIGSEDIELRTFCRLEREEVHCSTIWYTTNYVFVHFKSKFVQNFRIFIASTYMSGKICTWRWEYRTCEHMGDGTYVHGISFFYYYQKFCIH